MKELNKTHMPILAKYNLKLIENNEALIAETDKLFCRIQTSLIELGWYLYQQEINEVWLGKAKSLVEFFNDRQYNKIGYAQSMKYIRIFKHYILDVEAPITEVETYPMDILDRGIKIIGSIDEWNNRKDLLDAAPHDVKRNIHDITGEPLVNEKHLERVAVFIKSLMRLDTKQYLERLCKDTGLNHFTHQIKCFKCGAVTDLQPDHIVTRGTGGSDMPENIRPACAKCHRERHDT